MNTATNNLENDHVHILRLIDVMEHITHTVNPDITNLERIVDIIRNFADGLHHAKEENIFFPLLSQRGFSTTQGPVAVMLHEHTLGRNFVRGIAENISRYKGGNSDSLNEIYFNMNGYAELLRSHISKENNILFRMADNALSDSDQADLLVKFKKTEISQSGSSDPEQYIKQIEELVSFYGI
jgi:hemerythrin-like domain-containing protein